MNYTKVCTVCQVEKTIEEFAKHNNKPSYRCKQCLSEYNRKYYKKNTEKVKENVAKFKNDNPEYMKLWELKNKKYRKTYRKKYNQENKNAINRHERARRKTDHAYRIKKNLRRRVNEIITRQSAKCDSTFKLLGCSLEQLLEHLEKQFTKGMTWQNYGNKGWHIDHIRPCSSFDMSDPEQQRKCFHYTNLQPLWAEDNMKKGDKIVDIV